MNLRLAKEIRPLIFPGCLAASGALVILLRPLNESLDPSGMAKTLVSFLTDAAPFALCLGFALLTTVPFGVEFQHQTLGLLLAQPNERFRLWRDKMLITAGLAVTLASLVVSIAVANGDVRSSDWSAMQAMCLALYGIALVCSSCFWTLIARSTIGGAVFTSVTIFFVGGLTNIIVEKILEPRVVPETQTEAVPPPYHDLVLGTTYFVVGLLYSAIFLWLGWRKFSRMELRDAMAGEGLSLPTNFPGTVWFSRLLCCRPAGGLRNLVRKELRLHKSLFIIAAVFAACWLLTLAMLQLQPSRQKVFETIFNVLTASYIPLLTLLAGCLSLGEEKSLGLAAWHLTLPTPSRRQWLIKFLVAMGFTFTLGLLLPLLLAGCTLPKASVGLAYLLSQQGETWSLAVPLGVIYLLSFWSGSFSANAVRAIVTTLSAFVALVLLVTFATWCANQFDGLQTLLLSSITALTQSQPGFFYEFGFNLIGISIAYVVVVLVALKQSLTQFRRAQSQSRDLKKNALVLGVVIFAGTFWCADLAKSTWRSSVYRDGEYQITGPSFIIEVTEATVTVWQTKPEHETKQYFSINVQELEQTGKLSWLTKVWLRNAQITIDVDPSMINAGPQRGRTVLSIRGVVHLPNKAQVPFSYWKYKTETKP